MKYGIYRDGKKFRVYVDGITLVTDSRRYAERILEFILKVLKDSR